MAQALCYSQHSRLINFKELRATIVFPPFIALMSQYFRTHTARQQQEWPLYTTNFAILPSFIALHICTHTLTLSLSHCNKIENSPNGWQSFEIFYWKPYSNSNFIQCERGIREWQFNTGGGGIWGWTHSCNFYWDPSGLTSCILTLWLNMHHYQ